MTNQSQTVRWCWVMCYKSHRESHECMQ